MVGGAITVAGREMQAIKTKAKTESKTIDNIIEADARVVRFAQGSGSKTRRESLEKEA